MFSGPLIFVPPPKGCALFCAFWTKNTRTVIDFAKRTQNFYKVFQKTINNSYWAIKAIFSRDKIYQCVFYVIYKLAVLLESMVFLESFDV